MASKGHIQISPTVQRFLLKILNAVGFNGEREFPQEFWTQEEFAILHALTLRLYRAVEKKKEKHRGR